MSTKYLRANVVMVVGVMLAACASATSLPRSSTVTPGTTTAELASPVLASPEVTSTRQALTETTDVSTATATATVIPESDWQAVYDELSARHRQDTLMCTPTPVPTPEPCPRPASDIGVAELKQQIWIEIILDASGSMAASIDGVAKLEIAEEAIKGFVATFPVEAQVALRVYGHIGSNQEQDKALSCDASELVASFSPVDPGKMQSLLDAIQPSGWTPIDTSLRRAAEDFAPADASTTTTFVYLVSDGIETCDGNPVAAAGALHATPSGVVVSVIGFDVDPAATQQLRDVAVAGGGSYYEARNPPELEQVFQEAIDWGAWKQHYYCTRERWHVFSVQVHKVEDQRHRCVRDAANREFSAIRGDVEGGPQYAQVRRQVIEHAQAHRDTVITRSRDEREQAITAAGAQERSASSTADAQRRQATPAATATAD